MRQQWKLPLAFVCLLALASLPLLPAPRGSAQSVTYTVTDIGAPGGASSAALGLDECGRVVGEFAPEGQTSRRPFVWAEGTLTDLGTFGGATGRAWGVNTSGAVTGSASTAVGMDRPFIWRTAAGGKTDLGAPSSTAVAFDINESGRIVGQWDTGGGGSLNEQAFVWTEATGMQIIAGAAWGTPSAAYGVNDAGHVVGTAQKTASVASRAFHLSGSVLTEIGALGGNNSFAYEVNESDVVVGYAHTSTGINPNFHAFRWTAATGIIQDLGTLGGARSQAFDVNDAGVIVGSAQNAGGAPLAFIWSDDNANNAPDAGEMKDLNVVAPGTGWTFQEARGVNERGQIVGVGVNPSGQTRAFLLTPSNVAPSPCDATPTPTPTPTPVPGSLQFSSPTFAVSEEGPSAFIGISRTGGTSGVVAVNYATSDGTATAGRDYTAGSGTVVLSDTQSFAGFSIPITDDALDEPGETINLTLSSPTGGATLGPQVTAVLTITDDETAPNITITSGVTVTEGNTGSTVNAVFDVTLSAPTWQTVTVNYSTAPSGSATAGSDYTAVPVTQLTFNPGETSKQITVSVTGDNVDEPNETFIVALDAPTNATFASFISPFGVGTIVDDDGAPSLTLGDAAPVTEGNAGTAAATFTVTLLPASGQTVTVNYQTADGTATTASGDYAAASGTLTFEPGQTSKTITVNANGDTTPESHETFLVNLSGASNATVSDAQGQGVISNDDTSLSINDVLFFPEGNSGTGSRVFTVSLSRGSVLPVSVNFATADGTATAGADYEATSGTLNIPANSGSGTITVQVKGDNTFENDEDFFVDLSAATDAVIGDAQGRGRILNDEQESFFQFSGGPNFSVPEGVDTGKATFTVTRSASGSTAGGVVVNCFTGNDTATAGSDYTAVSGTLTFAEGELSKTFDVPITNDTLDEADERVIVSITQGFGASRSTGGSVFLTIADDDGEPPTVLFNAVAYAVGEAGGKAVVTVIRAGDPHSPVTATYATSDGTATAGSDYTAATGTLTFAAGETSKSFDVLIADDPFDEPSESVNLSITGATGATVGSQGAAVLTINDNDDTPTLSIGDATVNEGDAGATPAVFTVTLSAASGRTVTVTYGTFDNTAKQPGDYAATSGTLTFNPGETTKTVTVQVNGDTGDEPNETFDLQLLGALNAVTTDTLGVGAIIDDDGPPSVTIGDAAPVAEGNSGTTAATFAVTLSAASGRTVTVNYATANGTAAAPGDYAAASGVLVFNPGETQKTITVQVNGDTSNEADETFFVNLLGASSAILPPDVQGAGTILNDDAARFDFEQAAYPAGEAAHFVTVTVTRTGDAALPATVDFATSDGTATERRDYTAVSGTLRFGAGETSKTFDVLLTDDAYDEPDETINLTLSNAAGDASLGAQATAAVVIAANDDPAPAGNPIDISSEFVRQHYHDFLNREPDSSGLQFWTNEIESCGSDAACREVKRINVSAAFFLSIEFQETGYFAYRAFKAAYGDTTSPNVEGTAPIVRLGEFLKDTRRMGEGVVVGPGDWQAQLEANKNAYMLEFVRRQRFLDSFPVSMTAAEFVDKLNQNAGGVLSAAERAQLIAELSSAADPVAGRAAALRRVSEDEDLKAAEKNRAFVLMQFYGYLRRNPDDPQDVDFRGWKFWLDKLNQFNGDAVAAEMVKAFISSDEYRNRFAQ